jgi:hypothetical protein
MFNKINIIISKRDKYSRLSLFCTIMRVNKALFLIFIFMKSLGGLTYENKNIRLYRF